MKKQTPNNSKDEASQKLRHFDEYNRFVAWIALPNSLRIPKTQKDFAKQIGVGEDTLSEWKQRGGFFKAVEKKRQKWGLEKTPEVLYALYTRILKNGEAQEVKLWLQFFDGWSEKTITEDRPMRPLEQLTDEELAAVSKEAHDMLTKK